MEVRGAVGAGTSSKAHTLIAAGADLRSLIRGLATAHVTATRNSACFKSLRSAATMDWQPRRAAGADEREKRVKAASDAARDRARAAARKAKEAEAAARKARADLEQQDNEWRATRAAEIRAADIRPRVTPVTSAKSRTASRQPSAKSRSASSAASAASTRPPSAAASAAATPPSDPPSPTDPAPSPTDPAPSPTEPAPSPTEPAPSWRRAASDAGQSVLQELKNMGEELREEEQQTGGGIAQLKQQVAERQRKARAAAKALRDGDVTVSAEARIVDRGLFAWNPPSAVAALVSSLD